MTLIILQIRQKTCTQMTVLSTLFTLKLGSKYLIYLGSMIQK